MTCHELQIHVYKGVMIYCEISLDFLTEKLLFKITTTLKVQACYKYNNRIIVFCATNFVIYDFQFSQILIRRTLDSQ